MREANENGSIGLVWWNFTDILRIIKKAAKQTIYNDPNKLIEVYKVPTNNYLIYDIFTWVPKGH